MGHRQNRLKTIWKALWISLVLAIGEGAGISPAQEPKPADGAEWVDVQLGDLQLRIPTTWQPFEATRDDMMPGDEGQWFVGDRLASEVFVSVFRDRPFKDFADQMKVESEMTINVAGGEGTLYQGTVETAAGASRSEVVTFFHPEGSLVTIVFVATEAAWQRHAAAFAGVRESARWKSRGEPEVPPTGPAMPAPIASPSTPPSPSAPPPTTPPAVPPPAVVDDRAWYVHGRGDYRMPLPAGWTVASEESRGETDFDFDTLRSPDGYIELVVARVCERATNAEQALERWRSERMRNFGTTPVQIRRLRIAGHPAMQIGYLDPSSGDSTFRLSFVAQSRRYAITVHCTGDVGIEQVPFEPTGMLEQIELLRDEATLARWSETTVESIRLRLPPNWQPVSGGWTGDERVTFAPPAGPQTARFSIERSAERHHFTMMLQPLLQSEETFVGARSATAFLGTLPGQGGTRMAVVLDWPESDGTSYCFACWTASGHWARYETTFRQILARAQVPGETRVDTDLKPRLIGELVRFERMHTFRGEGEYSLVAYVNGATVRDVRSGRTVNVLVDAPGWETWTFFRDWLAKDPQLAQRMGRAVSRSMPLLEDQIRIQLFEGGAMVSETNTRQIWWCTHRRR